MAARYDPANELPPDQVAAGSNKKFLWRCDAGPDHRWEAMATSIWKAATGGCPFCAGKRASVTNRLDVLYPQVAAEWDVQRNGGPPEVVAGSEKKAWWVCRAAVHHWQANIRNRTVLGAGCPECAKGAISAARSRPAKGRSLPEVAPAVAAQWHPTKNEDLRPEDVAALSNKRRWWLCEQGHEWQVPPSGRVSQGGNGCPFCYGRFATSETSLAAQRPDLAAQWHRTRNGELTPEMVKPGTSKPVWWTCPAGHEYLSKISNRASLGRGCPYCTGQKVGYGNDLATQDPRVAAEWDNEKNGAATPATVTVGGGKRYWWRCARGHSWRTTVPSRVAQGTGCPECASGWRRSKPEIALQCELALLLPAEVDGDTQIATPSLVTRADVICRDLMIVVEFDGSYWHEEILERDVARTQALTEAGWLVVRVRQDPLPLVGSFDVMCPDGDPPIYPMVLSVMRSIVAATDAAPGGHPAREALAALRERTQFYAAAGEVQAAEATAQAVAAGRVTRVRQAVPGPPPPPKPGRSLAEKSPVVAAEWHPRKNGPLSAWDVANARNESAWWLCSLCGAEWAAKISERSGRGQVGCPACGRARAGAQRARPAPGASLADLHPQVAAQWHPDKNGDLRPEDLKPGSHRVVWWRCDCGHEWQTAVGNRVGYGVTKPGTGCPACSCSGRSRSGSASPRQG
ncbi:zinc-ribbon domain-containing protein [Kocuria oceani]|uniref:zinc-ribbon domain-containing protein n=1 Tax=Kocuria oceani TaxID=988827 RepID=UPI0040351291